jgi:hypothetical protein
MASLLYNGVPADDSEEQKFECPEEGCGRCYRQRRNLMIHIKLDHTEPGAIPWHTCHADDCGKSFKYKCALNRHIVLYHSGPDAREAMLAKRRKNQEIRSFEPNEEKKWKMMIGGTENDPDSKLFQCCHDGCNRMFTSKGSLNLHIERKHERPFAFICPVATCARQFSYKHVLQTHVERVHKIPFNHEDFPNPKRQRTRKTQPISGDLNIDGDEAAGTGTMMVVASDSSDSDSLNDDELEEVLMESATAKKDKGEGDSAESSARAKRAKTATAAAAVAATTSPATGRKRAPRSSALGSLAELAQSRLAAEGAGAPPKEGMLPVQLYECDHPGCTKVSARSPLCVVFTASTRYSYIARIELYACLRRFGFSS